MKTTIKILFVLMMSGFIFTSCEKSSKEPELMGDQKIENTVTPMLTPEFRQALTEAIADYQAQYASERSGEFIPAFFSDGIFGFSDENMNLAVFYTIPDEDDYLILNADGTVDVKIKSNNAVAEAFDASTDESFSGEGAHMFMNYSGPVIPIFEPNLQMFMYYVFPDNDTPSSVWHGNGKVELVGGSGPERNLVAHLVASTGWKNVKRTVKIN